jgi:hypothetical protein
MTNKNLETAEEKINKDNGNSWGREREGGGGKLKYFFQRQKEMTPERESIRRFLALIFF